MRLCAVSQDPLGSQPLGPEREVAGGPFPVALSEIWVRYEQGQDPIDTRSLTPNPQWIPEPVAAPVRVVERNRVFAQDLDDRPQHIGTRCEEHHALAALKVLYCGSDHGVF